MLQANSCYPIKNPKQFLDIFLAKCSITFGACHGLIFFHLFSFKWCWMNCHIYSNKTVFLQHGFLYNLNMLNIIKTYKHFSVLVLRYWGKNLNTSILWACQTSIPIPIPIPAKMETSIPIPNTNTSQNLNTQYQVLSMSDREHMNSSNFFPLFLALGTVYPNHLNLILLITILT